MQGQAPVFPYGERCLRRSGFRLPDASRIDHSTAMHCTLELKVSVPDEQVAGSRRANLRFPLGGFGWAIGKQRIGGRGVTEMKTVAVNFCRDGERQRSKKRPVRFGDKSLRDAAHFCSYGLMMRRPP